MWIFAYGSLMWDPGFDHAERVKGTIHGFHRAFTKPSVHRWGSPESPAPTLELAPGGTCTGIAYRIDDSDRDDVMAYLRDREGEGFNFPEIVVDLSDGRTVEAVTAVHEHDPDRLDGKTVDELAAMAVAAEGEAGTGTDYVLETHRQVVACDIHDPHVDELAAAVRDRAEG